MELNEQHAAAAFTKQSAVFDTLFNHQTIVRYKRERVRQAVQQQLDSASHILELNSGTGEDAIWFAEKGHHVHATDISSGMQAVMREKLVLKGLQDTITMECCSFTQLESLSQKGPYDLIFSNFAGLNCTGDLNKVLHSFDALLNPYGLVILVIMPGFCLWETALLLKGKFKTAFRRVSKSKTVAAHVEGLEFACRYYNPSYIRRTLAATFRLVAVEGLCTLVPPSYMQDFPEKHPRAYQFLKRTEDRLKNKWPWNCLGDYYIISLRKKD